MDFATDDTPHTDRKTRRRKRRAKRRQWFRTRLSAPVSTVRSVVAEPRAVPSRVREALLKIWRLRGGGFYGLGYVVAFVILEIRAFAGNFQGDGDVTSMILQEVLGFFFRFATQSFLNGFIAFGWPVFVVDYLGGWGLLLIGVSWYVFDRWAKPWINSRVPELARQQPSADEAKTEPSTPGPDQPEQRKA